VLSAGDAAAPLAELLPGGRPLAALFRAFPGSTDRVYRLVARNRGRLARLLRIDSSCEVRR
jgi:predicted DCC family thiol-disulfide oxidoreductase YuxK